MGLLSDLMFYATLRCDFITLTLLLTEVMAYEILVNPFKVTYLDQSLFTTKHLNRLIYILHSAGYFDANSDRVSISLFHLKFNNISQI